MRDNFTVFDIETEPAPESELALVMPEFTAPANYKDPAKIADNIAEQRMKWRSNAALSPLTGRILAIGTMDPLGGMTVDESDEPDLIRHFFAQVMGGGMGSAYRMVGFNCNQFDLPFIIKRAWKHGIDVPTLRSGRYWASWIIDLRDIWTFGDRQGEGSLGIIAQFMGLGKKEGSGADFAKLYHDPATRAQAILYLQNDLRITKAIADRILP